MHDIIKPPFSKIYLFIGHTDGNRGFFIGIYHIYNYFGISQSFLFPTAIQDYFITRNLCIITKTDWKEINNWIKPMKTTNKSHNAFV